MVLKRSDTWVAPGLGRGRRATTIATTVVAADHGLIIDCTANSFTVSITAAATLGSGFSAGVYNSGSGTITVDPNGAETIRTPAGTTATVTLSQGQGIVFFCDGSNFDAIELVGNAAGTSTTDNAVARWDGTNGKLQNSGVIIDDSNNVTGVGTLTTGGNVAVTATKTGALSIVVTNNATSTGDFARIQAKADSAPQINMDAFSSGYTGTAFGITLANYQLLSCSSSTSNGFILGHTANKPVIFGISTNEIARFTSGTLTTGAFTLAYTTEATSVSAAAIVNPGGLGVAKRSFLGTIGSSFKGNVDAGVQDATAAVSGQVGETQSSVVSGVALAATTVTGNITSLTLGPGDWAITGMAVFDGGGTGLTVNSNVKLSIVTTTATDGTEGDNMAMLTVPAAMANGKFTMTIPRNADNISSSTTYYLTANVAYTAGSPTASGFLKARRMR